MAKLLDTPLSVLDLAPVAVDKTAADAFKNSLDLAQHAETWGYNRYWVAEHHNMPGIASTATSVLIGFLAAGTSSIRVGSGRIPLGVRQGIDILPASIRGGESFSPFA